MSLFEKNPRGKKPENKAKLVDQRAEFLKDFKRLVRSSASMEANIWHDFITMFAISLSNPVDKAHFDKRESRYLDIIHKYDKREDREMFPKLAAHVVLALERNPEQDFLGGIFTELDLGSRARGQTFTPYPVSTLMASVTLDDIVQQIKENGYTTIIDPCCGSGVNLIAAVNLSKAKLEPEGINHQNALLISAQDIDETVGLMCYIQLSLLGMAGYVKIGNSLTNPMTKGDDLKDYWFTPMYFLSPIWSMRRMLQSIKDMEDKSNVKI